MSMPISEDPTDSTNTIIDDVEPSVGQKRSIDDNKDDCEDSDNDTFICSADDVVDSVAVKPKMNEEDHELVTMSNIARSKWINIAQLEQIKVMGNDW